ncbi:hypothetical protein FOZ60_011522 [Perkinsus olseni]|uniref:Uncharacterized protein n=1 Tax=Perkinsus olseni TaxID=32597 RepID=A0A7J6NDA5_PEROL|nr:hypothetical protein FOZ60_011522 [Perkinsus olseni]
MNVPSGPLTYSVDDKILSPNERFDILQSFVDWEKATKGLEKKQTTLKAFVDKIITMRDAGTFPLRASFTEQQVIVFVRNWKQRKRPAPEEVRAQAEKELRSRASKGSPSTPQSSSLSALEDAAQKAMAAVDATASASAAPDFTGADVSPLSTLGGGNSTVDVNARVDPVDGGFDSRTRKRTRSYAECIDSVADAADSVKRLCTMGIDVLTRLFCVAETSESSTQTSQSLREDAVLQADAVQADVVQADAVQADAVQADAVQTDAVQTGKETIS